MGVARTIIFENRYKTNIKQFSTTHQVTSFLEKKLNKPLKTISLNQNIVSKRGNVFPIKSFDVDNELDRVLNSKE